MPKWIPCGEDFDIGHVVRWKEGAWYNSPRRRKRGKGLKIGDRHVTAQVLAYDPKGFILLDVLKCEATQGRLGIEVEPFKKHEILRRQRGTIARGGAERMVPKADAPKRLPSSKFARTKP
ncbi:MAG TPA: hypothetical protein VN428_22765 [Bryobacteraceae bacterium]|nr:hypothetical protein [Bryobacteraceae bacterium]